MEGKNYNFPPKQIDLTFNTDVKKHGASSPTYIAVFCLWEDYHFLFGDSVLSLCFIYVALKCCVAGSFSLQGMLCLQCTSVAMGFMPVKWFLVCLCYFFNSEGIHVSPSPYAAS